MIKYRIEIYTNYKNDEGNYRKSVFESDHYQETVDKFNELTKAVSEQYESTLSEQDLYDHNTCTYNHYFQVEMVSQQHEYGDWRGHSSVVKGDLEKYVGEYKF